MSEHLLNKLKIFPKLAGCSEVQSFHAGLKVDVGDLTFTEVMLPLAYGVIGLGVIIGALSLLGCIGGCYSIKTVLVVVSFIIYFVLFILKQAHA